MFQLPDFLDATAVALDKHLTTNKQQHQAITADKGHSLFLVAGPGSGKTTVLALRVLKLIFVDKVPPSTILATTFTKRAAAELRSRILGWGDNLRDTLKSKANQEQQQWLERLDLNQIFIGTLDSIAQQVLLDFRSAGMQPPVMIDEFIGRTFMFRKGVLETNAWNNLALKLYLKNLCCEDSILTHHIASLASEIRQRFIHDQVDREQFRASQPTEVNALFEVIDAYEQYLDSIQVLDFASLEQSFYQRLKDGSLKRFTDTLQVVLVDEYQDTNLLQESIYFTLARAAHANKGSITVVGDDDQSLYRFRGATVDLFRDFVHRLEDATGILSQTIYLNTNYRSTPSIVEYTMKYLQHDPDYSAARVAGKPPLIAGRATPSVEYPILAMFRDDLQCLATDLVTFIQDVVDKGRTIATQHGNVHIPINPSAGSVGDIALLSSSPQEYSSSKKPRLPLLLRQALLPSIRVFNPRGQEFSEIESVARICGLILECIDPKGDVQTNRLIRKLPNDVYNTLNDWRSKANEYIATNPPAPGIRRHSLGEFVQAWKDRKPQHGSGWPQSVRLIELLYNLIVWIPEMQEDAEGLVYLEAITRIMAQSAHFSRYNAEIFTGTSFDEASVEAAINDILAPLAAGHIEIDEDLLETTPRDRLNILSIHQAKGLEFPLVIVDVGSDFKRNHWKQHFKRFPTQHGRPQALEDALRPHSPLLTPKRSALDRAFDDLLRLYFVAFSRPQDVLLLVGLRDPKTHQPNSKIPNIALGWNRRDPSPNGLRWPIVPNIVYI